MNVRFYLSHDIKITLKVSKRAKIRNQYNQVPHLTQDTNGKVTNSQLSFLRKKSYTHCCYGRHFIQVLLPENLKTTSGLLILMHGVISIPDTTSCDKK